MNIRQRAWQTVRANGKKYIGIGGLVAFLIALALLGSDRAYAADPPCVPTCIPLPSSIDLNQWDRDKVGGADWITGAINSGYREGDSVPFQVKVNGLTGSYYLRICRDFQNGAKRGYYYLTAYNVTVSPTIISGTTSTFGHILGVNVTVTGEYETGSAGSCNSADARETLVTFTATGAATASIYYGARLAAPGDTLGAETVGIGNGASQFSGGSLSMRVDPTKNVGIQVNGILPSTFITVRKFQLYNGNYYNLNGWCFSISPNPNNAPLPLCASSSTNSVTFSGLPTGTYTLSESLQSGWTFVEIRNTSVNCGRIVNTNNASAGVTAATTPITAICDVVNRTTATSVSLSSFKGVARDKDIKLKWRTGTEVDVLGFYVYRSDTKDAGYKPLNDALIPAKKLGQLTGAKYVLHDATAQPGSKYFYKLELVDRSGATLEWSDIIRIRKPPSQ